MNNNSKLLWAALLLTPLLAAGQDVPLCDASALTLNSYCVHCGSSGEQPLVCVAEGGKACKATVKGKEQVLPLCSSLGPLGAKDGACLASVQGRALTYSAESLLLAAVATCPSAADCNCSGGAAGQLMPLQDLAYFHRPCGATSLPAGTLPKCSSVSVTGRQRLSSCLAEAASNNRCYSEVTMGGQAYWVLDHSCSDPLVSNLAPAGAAPECTGPAAAAVMATATSPVVAMALTASLTPPRKRFRRPAAVQVRLVGGTPNKSGRLEIFVGGSWGTVCDNSFTDREADAICRQLGLRTPGVAVGGAFFGQGTGKIWLDGLFCYNFENRIQDCYHTSWGVISRKCTHANDVGVICDVPNVPVRLVGGPNAKWGRLEVQVAGQWGTVCTDGISEVRRDELAQAVCRQLNYSPINARVIGNALYGRGTGRIWGNDFDCDGTEPALGRCKHRPWGSLKLGPAGLGPSCDHTGDISIQCEPPPLAMRLAGGDGNSGRLEISLNGPNGPWGTVCNGLFGDLSAAVVCRTMNKVAANKAPGIVIENTNNRFGSAPSNAPIWLAWIACFGDELTMEDCRRMYYSNTLGCSHSRDVHIQCMPDLPTGIQLRLVGGTAWNGRYASGRVDVFKDGQWGTVCAEGFEDEDATVVCRQLGYVIPGQAAKGRALPGFPTGTGPIWLTYLGCRGNEAGVQYCPHRPWGDQWCFHYSDVGVECGSLDPDGDTQLRLVGGRDKNSGRLELNYAGQGWGTSKWVIRMSAVAATGSAWAPLGPCLRPLAPTQSSPTSRYNGTSAVTGISMQDNAASVACLQMKLRQPGIAIASAYFGQGTGKIWLQNVVCTGSEFRLHSCNHSPWGQVDTGITHAHDVSIICNVQPVSVRLTGGLTKDSGRLEVQVDGKWGTVCNEQFDDIAATVVCRQLGLPTPGRMLGPGYFGAGASTSRIWLTGVACSGDETRLPDCPHNTWGTRVASCTHAKDVGIACGLEARLPACTGSGSACTGATTGVPVCTDPKMSANRFCTHCARPGATPFICLASGQPCTYQGNLVQSCSVVARPTDPLEGGGGCYQKLGTKGGLTYQEEPFWAAITSTCPSPVACNCTGPTAGPPGIRVLHRVSQPYYNTPCWTSNDHENLGTAEAGVLDQCADFQYTGRQRMSGCSAENRFLWCYVEFKLNGKSYWTLDHSCKTPLDSQVSYPGDPLCNQPCEYTQLAENRYCIHCPAPGVKPTICLASGKPCVASRDGSVWNPKVPLCSTVAPLGAPYGECYTTMQGAALAYANVPYWLAQQTHCWNPADCKCTGGTPGQRVMLFIDGTLLDAPCSGANKMGKVLRCQQFYFTGRQALANCANEGAVWQYNNCYSEVTVGGKNYWIADHSCSPQYMDQVQIGLPRAGCGL